MFKRVLILLVAISLLGSFNFAFSKLLEKKRTRLPTKEERANRIKDRVTKLSIQLSLNEEQRKKITDILNRSKEEIYRILEETGEKIADLKLQTEKNLQDLLTKEQREKYNKIYQEEQAEDEDMTIFKSSY